MVRQIRNPSASNYKSFVWLNKIKKKELDNSKIYLHFAQVYFLFFASSLVEKKYGCIYDIYW